MLTRCVEKGREKCDRYWPYDTQPVFYGDIQVSSHWNRCVKKLVIGVHRSIITVTEKKSDVRISQNLAI